MAFAFLTYVESQLAVPVKLPKHDMSGIQITEVRVRNFRCLLSVDVYLDKLVVLLGANNAGKTSFLQALFAAIGAGQKTMNPEDIFLRHSDRTIPKDRAAVVDILIRATDGGENLIDDFPEGSPWVELWGQAVVADADEKDIVAIRATYQWSAVKGDYVLERRFLKGWNNDPAKWAETKPLEAGGVVTPAQIEPIALHFLDAQRDIAEDIKSRHSFFGKMVEDHGLSTENVGKIEKALSDINKDIVEGSAVFTHIQSHLEQFHETLACEKDGVSITPIARQLRDLSRGMDVILSTTGAPPFPLHHQGMGTRSLGTFFTFWAFTTWRQKQAKTSALHPLMAMEEPECHLHPQAQRALFRQIAQMPGQRIITTHSPHICALADIRAMRHFSKQGESTQVTQLSSDATLTVEDIRKIDRQVMNTRGDMLFARALIFFEGETEEQALPDFAEKYWGKHPHDLGFSFVGVGGSTGYLPFLRMAEVFKLPWFVFSDGEANALKDLDKSLRQLGLDESAKNPRIVFIPDGDDFETHILKVADLVALIDDEITRNAANAKHEDALKKEWAGRSTADNRAELLRRMYDKKTQYGSRLGKLLAVPPILQELFKRIDAALAPPEESTPSPAPKVKGKEISKPVAAK